jgi:hypothetical protein
MTVPGVSSTTASKEAGALDRDGNVPGLAAFCISEPPYARVLFGDAERDPELTGRDTRQPPLLLLAAPVVGDVAEIAGETTSSRSAQPAAWIGGGGA